MGNPARALRRDLPAGVLVALSSTKIGDVVDRFGTPRVIAAGFTFLVVGYALFLRITLTPSYAAVILPSTLLLGAACALTFPSLNIQATNGLDDEQGMVSGLPEHLDPGRRGDLPCRRHRGDHGARQR